LGFTEDQTESIMAGHVATLVAGKPIPPLPEPQPDDNGTHLQAVQQPAQWKKLLQDNVREKDSPEVNLARLKNAAAKNVVDHIAELEKYETPAKLILEVLKQQKR
jgi:hypothetical protein